MLASPGEVLLVRGSIRVRPERPEQTGELVGPCILGEIGAEERLVDSDFQILKLKLLKS